MDEKGSLMVISEEKINNLSPMFFGVSCALFALKLLPEPEICDDRWLEIRNRMLKGSAHLLGLFVWRVQREESSIGKAELLRNLENAQKEIKELKKIRREDAKANAKVVSIVATREQSWFDERKKLRQQIGFLMNELRVLEMKSEKSMFEKLKENEAILEEREQKRLEIEEKLNKSENLVNELRENGKREAQRHSNEISKHKTAFIELVSNQRQLEAEMGRALRQVEAAKQELDLLFEQKEHSVLLNQRLSMELVQMRNNLDQKDQILSAMLRKSKLDTAERQMLLKEVKSSKVKKNQAELERARFKAVSETKLEKNSLRKMLSERVKSDVFLGGKGVLSKSLDAENFRPAKKDYHLEFEQPEIKGLDVFSLISDSLIDGKQESHLSADAGHLENWVNSEAEKNKITIDQRHNFEIEAFAEQLRLKDEKFEDFRWRFLSMELESKRLQSHIEGLDHDISQLKHDNMKLEALLLDRESELHTMKEQLVLQFNPPNLQKLNFSSSPQDTIWSKVKVIKRKPGQKMQEMKTISEEISHKDIVLTLEYPDKEIKEGKITILPSDHFRQKSIDSEDSSNAETSVSVMSKKGNLTWKMDINALGVSYKIKRLKQQLLMLERLTGKKESCEKSDNNGHFGIKGFYALISVLNKQIDRYQSLQEKTDDLCNRMHDGNLNLNSGASTIARTGIETKQLEQFLEETFQLQRYIVATGQKLMEVQTKIVSGFVSDAEDIEKPESYDMKRFADSIRTLFREVQRGLELRISRIIGDLGGTLACDGIIHLKR